MERKDLIQYSDNCLHHWTIHSSAANTTGHYKKKVKESRNRPGVAQRVPANTTVNSLKMVY